jgi:hypothetical protein
MRENVKEEKEKQENCEEGRESEERFLRIPCV